MPVKHPERPRRPGSRALGPKLRQEGIDASGQIRPATRFTVQPAGTRRAARRRRNAAARIARRRNR